jgi:hypothetical protein
MNKNELLDRYGKSVKEIRCRSSLDLERCKRSKKRR